MLKIFEISKRYDPPLDFGKSTQGGVSLKDILWSSSYFGQTRRIFERVARAEVRARYKFRLILHAGNLDVFCTLNEKLSLKTRIYNLKNVHPSYMAIYEGWRGSEPRRNNLGKQFACIFFRKKLIFIRYSSLPDFLKHSIFEHFFWSLNCNLKIF